MHDVEYFVDRPRQQKTIMWPSHSINTEKIIIPKFYKREFQALGGVSGSCLPTMNQQ